MRYGDDRCGALSYCLEVDDNPVSESSARTMTYHPWVAIVFH